MIKNEKGLTLIEIIIAIAILSLMLGIATFSIRIIYTNSLEANVQELRADLQDIQYRSMTDMDKEYRLVLSYIPSDGQYIYSIEEISTIPNVTIKSKEFPKHFIIKTENGNALNSNMEYKFSSDLGQGIDNGTTFEDGISVLNFSSNNTSKEMELTVVQLTGRVIVDEN
mgnify:CR=1 FL=1